MKESRFESSGGSFFSGKKKYAKCVDTYVDKYNSVSPSEGAKCRITQDKYYEVVDEGTFINPTNAFKTRFPMIFIKDDNLNVWGLPEEMFNMDDQYSPAWKIEENINQSKNKLTDKKQELNESDLSEETLFDDDEEEFDSIPILPEKNIVKANTKPEVVKSPIQKNTIKEEKKESPFSIKMDLEKLVKDRLLKEKIRFPQLNAFKIKSIPSVVTSKCNMMEILSNSAKLTVVHYNSCLELTLENGKIKVFDVIKNTEQDFGIVLFALEGWLDPMFFDPSFGEKTKLFLSSVNDISSNPSKEFLIEDDFLRTTAKVAISYEKIFP